MRATRRRVLAGGVATGALLALGGGLSWVSLGYRLRSGEVAIGLSEKELCVVRALVDALLPAADGMPGGVDVGVHQRIDEEVWAAQTDTASDLRAAIQLIEHAPPLFGRASRMSRLPVAERAAVLERLAVSGVDVVVQASVSLKQMAHLFYYGHPKVWPHLGYDGPLVATPRPPASSRRYAELLAARRRPA